MALKQPPVQRDAAYWRKRAVFYARQHGINPGVFTRQIKQESGFRTDARSPAGALGIAQIVPKWHPGVDPLNPEAALNYAAKHMSEQVKKYGNYRDALAVYNSGRPWKESQRFAETNNYVKTILGGGKGLAKVKAPVQPRATRMPVTQMGAIPAQAAGTLNDIFRKAGLQPLDIVGDIPLPTAKVPRLAAPPLPPAAASALPQPIPKGTKLPRMNLMLTAIQQAQALGLRVSENSYVDQVDPVHTKGSDHYKTIGRKGKKKVSGALDVSGNPKAMRAFFQWAEQYAGRGLNDLFFDPMNYSYDRGKRWDQTIGNHGDHVHFSV